MDNRTEVVSRRRVVVVGLVVLLGAAPLYAGIPKTGKGTNNGNSGPYGLPSLKRVTDACSLTQAQEQAVLRIYNEYKHQQHEEMQSKTPSGSGREDCINAVKKEMTPDQQKKFDSLLSEGKGKKKS
jgi:hypothetical protein